MTLPTALLVLSFPSRIGFSAKRAAVPGLSETGTERKPFVDPDELAIYGWINSTKLPSDVKRERRRVVALQAIRYGLHHYLEDIWQEWQLAVHQRIQIEPPVPTEEREFFSFGIARNLCRSYLRKDRGMIPFLDPAAPAEEGAAGIRERELTDRRADRPAGPLNKAPEPESMHNEWNQTENLNECIGKLRPSAQQILRKTYIDGKASHEIGRDIGLSPANVRQQLSRAREELRNCLTTRHGRPQGKDWRHADIKH